MPRISEFFGITVLMYWFDTQKHREPHFHARYQGREAVFTLDGRCLAGDLGGRASRLIAEWCQERQEALTLAWSAANTGKEIPWVMPLE